MAKRDQEGLTLRQTQFISEYLVSRNVAKAAVAAGYSPNGAASNGAKLLRHPLVKEKIDAQMNRIQRKTGVSAEWVLEQLAAVAGQEDVAQSTKVRALELLAKHLGMLEERVTLKTDGLTAEQRTERVVMLLERAKTRLVE